MGRWVAQAELLSKDKSDHRCQVRAGALGFGVVPRMRVEGGGQSLRDG